MVRQRGDALLDQPGRGLVDLLARLAVDDAGVAVVLVAQEAQQLLARLVLLDHGVADVRPVEAADEDARVAEGEPLDDVGAGQVVGGRGQGDARHAGIALVQDRELEVVLAEVVAPLADAVRLVDREQREQAALVQRIELGQQARRRDPLRRGVEQHQAPAHHLALDPDRVVGLEGRVEEGGMDAGLLERADLVVHQRDQRADDHRDALAARDGARSPAPGSTGSCRRRWASAPAHRRRRSCARRSGLLQAAERGVAEDLGEDAARGVGRGGRRRRRVGSAAASATAIVVGRGPRGQRPRRAPCEGYPAEGLSQPEPATDNRRNPSNRNGSPPWHRSTKSSSSATSAATPRFATTRTAAPGATSAIATSRSWKDKDSGEKVEETEWHRVVFYDRLAEIAGEYLKKGRSVYVEGRLKTRKWNDKDGAEKYTTEIIAEEMQMLGGREGMGGGGGDEDSATAAVAAAAVAARAPGAGGASGRRGANRPAAKSSTGFDNMDDDIPF